MALPLINPAQILDSYRKSDAVLIVCQNNTSKTIEIAAINDQASRVLGYNNENLVGKALDSILPERIGSTIAEFVEYGEEGNDLLAVLSKVRNFAVKTADGNEAGFKLRVIRGESIHHNPWFHLVLVDEENLRKSNVFREILKENFKGHEVLNERTLLPDRASLIKDLELVVYHVRDKEISASFAIIDINHYENLLEDYGPEICNRLHRHIGHVCKLKLRGEDTVGSLSDRSLGIILVDAGQEPARMVLNRLRWAIGASPLEVYKKGDLLAQVNVSFSQIDGQIREIQLLEKCEAYMIAQRRQASNKVELVVTHERRTEPGRKDRRKATVPVIIERRRKDRRKEPKGS
jgi:diguanylate cyclase (GGDEF)-like protein